MFSTEWEERFVQGKSLSLWPWTDLIKYVNRYADLNKNDRVLELGPGVGANIPYFLSIGADYYAIEGSKTAVKIIHERYPQLIDKVVHGDFTKDISFDQTFDLVVDRSSLTHNDTENIIKSLKLVAERLTMNGLFIGIDWFSWIHNQSTEGEIEVDPYTFTFSQGQFAGCGKVHFSTEEHLRMIFTKAGYEIKVLEHKTIQGRIVYPDKKEATWNLMAKVM